MPYLSGMIQGPPPETRLRRCWQHACHTPHRRYTVTARATATYGAERKKARQRDEEARSADSDSMTQTQKGPINSPSNMPFITRIATPAHR